MRTRVGTINKDDTNYIRFRKDKLFFRHRGLKELQERFDENIIKTIVDMSKKQKIVRILEIGFGEGKALLEACSLGKNIYGYGVNDKKRVTLASSKHLLKNAKEFGIEVFHTPKIHFYDAGNGLKFKDNYFDIVFSQVAIHYVGDKVKLFEDAWRVLKRDGKAFLHIDSKLHGKNPDFMYFHKDAPRLVIYHKNNKIVSAKSVFDKYRKKGFGLRLVIRNDERGNIILVMTKKVSKDLDLGLEYDGNSTIYLTPLRDTDTYKFDTGIWWGTRSVYRIRK